MRPILVISGQREASRKKYQLFCRFPGQILTCLSCAPSLSLCVSDFLSSACLLFVWQLNTVKWHWRFSSLHSSCAGHWLFQTSDSSLDWLKGVTGKKKKKIPSGATRRDWEPQREMERGVSCGGTEGDADTKQKRDQEWGREKHCGVFHFWKADLIEERVDRSFVKQIILRSDCLVFHLNVAQALDEFSDNY